MVLSGACTFPGTACMWTISSKEIGYGSPILEGDGLQLYGLCSISSVSFSYLVLSKKDSALSWLLV